MVLTIVHRFGRYAVSVIILWLKHGMADCSLKHIMQLAQPLLSGSDIPSGLKNVEGQARLYGC